MYYKQFISDNENINLKMPSFLWQGDLPNQASKTKRLLARQLYKVTPLNIMIDY
jgi:hypothetical protein